MARLLLAALREGGHAVELVSTVRSFLPVADPIAMDAVAAEAEREVRRLEARFAAEGAPDLWFTYHSLLQGARPARAGPRGALRPALCAGRGLARRQARRRPLGGLARRQRGRHPGRRPAPLLHAARRRGALGLARPDSIVPLPPFIAAGAPAGAAPAPRAEGAVALVTVAMMRPGDKARSYAALAEALAGLAGQAGMAADGRRRRTRARGRRAALRGPAARAAALGRGAGRGGRRRPAGPVRPLRLAGLRRGLRPRLSSRPPPRACRCWPWTAAASPAWWRPASRASSPRRAMSAPSGPPWPGSSPTLRRGRGSAPRGPAWRAESARSHGRPSGCRRRWCRSSAPLSAGVPGPSTPPRAWRIGWP